MTPRRELAGRAYQEALRLRQRLKRSSNVPVCPFDLAEELDLEVLFVDIASMEAMYVDDGTPKILISSDRPPGRQRFSCAHELGHHLFGHGTHISCIEIAMGSSPELSDEEFLAQAFAGFLLLPKAAVSNAFVTRSWSLLAADPEQFYIVASSLGVSFEALVTHCEHGLQLLPRRKADTLRAIDLQRLRTRIANTDIAGNLVVMDQRGSAVAVDLRVGDALLTPPGTLAMNNAITFRKTTSAGVIMLTQRPGLAGIRFEAESEDRVVRIARARYIGRAMFRHLEDPDHV